jgi:NAD(P)-dependent dehydrogenase (short-subunit alcohol dehydrogenase family)
VAVAYREQQGDAKATVASIRADGGDADAFAAHLVDTAAAERLLGWVDSRFGTLDALVYCAARPMARTGLLALDPQEFDRQIAVNLAAPAHCLRLAAQRMARSRGGRGGSIVMLSSEAARFGGRNIAAYTAAKGGINALVLAAARELAPEGIRVNAVSPGVIDTDMVSAEGPAAVAALAANIPMARLGRPEEVASTVLWLLSDAASYVCGAIVPVTGAR